MSIDSPKNLQQELSQEISKWEHAEGNKGQVYTKPEVVSFMLKVIGLGDDVDIADVRILEPSCGEGEFVVAIVAWLLKDKPSIELLMGKLLAVDLVGSSLTIAQSKVHKLLTLHNYQEKDISQLLDNWFLQADFLLEPLEANFTHIIGNPPYVRLESIPKPLLKTYRERFTTMKDRADLYVAFFEKSLSLLKEDGKLSFICTDRWTKNIYGKSLRQSVSERYSLEVFIDLYGVEAFETEVMTYPAITQIVNKRSEETAFVQGSEFSDAEASEILKAVHGKRSTIDMRKGIVNGGSPWLLGSVEETKLIQHLEANFPTLEEAGCKVYIGAATGANKIYMVDKDDVDIEPSRLLPVITANELKSGELNWAGKYIINTFDGDEVIDLGDYPKLAEYLTGHKDVLANRHKAKKKTVQWYRTIDWVYERRAKSEKLLIPDIGNEVNVVYDDGKFYPNNSIYYICSDTWNLHALKVILLSSITEQFMAAYSTKVARGYLRFQAQHLRKLRIPKWESLDVDLKTELLKAGSENSVAKFDELSNRVFCIH